MNENEVIQETWKEVLKNENIFEQICLVNEPIRRNIFNKNKNSFSKGDILIGVRNHNNESVDFYLEIGNQRNMSYHLSGGEEIIFEEPILMFLIKYNDVTFKADNLSSSSKLTFLSIEMKEPLKSILMNSNDKITINYKKMNDVLQYQAGFAGFANVPNFNGKIHLSTRSELLN